MAREEGVLHLIGDRLIERNLQKGSRDFDLITMKRLRVPIQPVYEMHASDDVREETRKLVEQSAERMRYLSILGGLQNFIYSRYKQHTVHIDFEPWIASEARTDGFFYEGFEIFVMVMYHPKDKPSKPSPRVGVKAAYDQYMEQKRRQMNDPVLHNLRRAHLQKRRPANRKIILPREF